MEASHRWFGGLILAAAGLQTAWGADSLDAPSQEALLSQAVLVTCPLGSTQATYSPPITNTPRDTRIEGSTSFGGCITLLGDPVLSGASAASYTVPDLTCSALLEMNTIVSRVTWNTQETSVLELTSLTVQAQGALTVMTHLGTVLSGKYAGATVVRVLTYPSIDLDELCPSPDGLPSQSGTATLAITRLL